jgi:hypothetical protein
MTLAINGTTPSVSSSDGKFYSGMTQQEAYADKELLDLFTFADKNGDKVIDEKEIIRYDGPILLENIETNTGRFIGSYNGYSGPYSSSGNTSGSIISRNEVEYYPGLKIEEMDERASIHTFRNLDYNADGELVKEEIEAYKDFAKYNQEINKLPKQSNSFITAAEAALVGIFPALAFGGLTGSFVVGAILMATCGAAGYLVQEIGNNAVAAKKQALDEEFNQKDISKMGFEYNSAIVVE